MYICYTTFLLSILHFLFLKYFYLVFPIHHPLLSCCVVKISQFFQPCKKKTGAQQQKPFPSEKVTHQKIISDAENKNPPGPGVGSRSPLGSSKGRGLGCLCRAMSEEVAESQGTPWKPPWEGNPWLKKNDLGAQFCLVGLFIQGWNINSNLNPYPWHGNCAIYFSNSNWCRRDGCRLNYNIFLFFCSEWMLVKFRVMKGTWQIT